MVAAFAVINPVPEKTRTAAINHRATFTTTSEDISERDAFEGAPLAVDDGTTHSTNGVLKTNHLRAGTRLYVQRISPVAQCNGNSCSI